MKLSQLPARVVTGAYIFHSGMQKWGGDEETAAALHGMASGAYPFLQRMEPARFLQLLAAGEMAVGAALAVPLVPERTAGKLLTGFAAGLMGLYFRTPGIREEGSIWPTQQGIALAKDVWLLGIGLNLLLSSAGSDRDRAREATEAIEATGEVVEAVTD